MYEQRKIVTALFCDLVGSTELSGILEPEMLRVVMLRYFDTMRGRIEAYGGTVEKFIGDAVMAVFGVPSVHEDDAHRAATAALSMIAALDDLNAELEDSLGCRLAVRIGLNTGEVITAAEDRMAESLVSGEVVNVAARLEQRAEPGRILIGPTTRALLGAAARVEPVGALALKGKRDPVPAFRLLGLQVEGPAQTRRFDSPFVGRGQELTRLSALWSGVRNGAGGRLVTVSGDAGIGKTRLVREWLAGLTDGDALAGAGRCHPFRDEASLAPLGAAISRILDEAAGSGLLDDRALGSPALRVLRAGLLDGGTPNPSAEGTYAAAAAVLADLARSRPVALILDDIQWARPMLSEGIGRLANALSGDRVLLICSGRPGQARADRVGAEFGAEPVGVPLLPLPLADSRTLAAHLVESQAHGDATLNAAVDRAEGNPLYLEQLLAMIGDGTDPGELPATVTAVLAARIDSLSPAARAALEACAVLGRQFDAAGIQLLIGALDQDRGPAALGELVRRGMLEPVPQSETQYRFGSVLIHEVTYQGISKRRRADWHEQLADVPGVESAAGGHHFEQAYLHRGRLGLRDKHTDHLRCAAARTLTDAGQHALARADLCWSQDLHERALAYSTPDDPWWTATAQGLGETWLALGRAGEGGDLLRAVLDGAESADDPLTYAHARLQLTSLEADSGLGSAADAARAALPVFETAGDRRGLARAHVRLAQEQQLLGRHRAADYLLAAALRHAVAAGAAPERAMALGAIGISLWHGPTPAGEAVRRCRELLAVHGADYAAVLVTLNYPLANLLALQGDFDAARDCLTAANRFAAGLGYAEAAGFGALFSAGVEVLAGRLEDAERLLRESVRQSRAVGNPGLLAAASRELARVLLVRGRTPDAELIDIGTPPSPGDLADLLGVRALAEAAAGRTGPALDLARQAVSAAETTDSPIARATAELDLARTCLAGGLMQAAGEAAGRAAERFGDKGHVVGRAAAEALSLAAGRGQR